MKSSEIRQFRKLDTFLNRVLTLLALINFFLLFLSVGTSGILVEYYIMFTAVVFFIYLLVHEIYMKLSWQRLFTRLPDIIMIVFLVLVMPPPKVFLFYLVCRQTLTGIRNLSMGDKAHHKTSLFEQMSANPPGYFMISFLLVISLGTMLLMLPAASAMGNETPFIDALFTATSATCVTGLVVYDTGTYFSLFGQLVILSLIQIGA
jgi:trk system potassium uptake protein TrkH